MSRAGTVNAALRLLGTAADPAFWWNTVGTLLLVAAGGALAALSPWVLKHLVDALATPTHGAVFEPGAAYLLVLVAGRVVADLRPLLAGRVEQQALTALRQRFVEHLFRLPIQDLVQRKGGEILHSVDLASAGLQLIVSHLANSIVPVAVELVVMGAVLVRLGQPSLVVLFAVTCLLYLALFAVGAKRLSRRASDVSAASLGVHARLGDAVAHNETLRCFGATAMTASQLRLASGCLASQWMRLHHLTLRLGLIASILFGLAMAACLILTTEAASKGTMTVGGVVLATVYMLQMTRPLEVLGSATRDVARALSFMRPLLEILERPEAPAESCRAASASARPPPAQAPSIRFENVGFGYDAHRPVLRGLNLDIPPGCTTAIVGSSGSGKSSIVKLLLRLYAPQSGRILIDGFPIDEMPVEASRALMALVPQDAALLHASAAVNIALGMPNARQDDIEAAARAALLHPVIDALPERYDTPLGERSQTLSGGERQRLAIARALLRQPRIYLLDEPTSMLDSRTEAAIMESLRTLTTGCTTLLIAHRLSTVMHADNIVVLQDGQVQERGSHAALLAQGGLYAQLWKQQAPGTA